MKVIKQQLIEQFVDLFGEATGTELFFAPGRVNLIGEHTDYNGGNVFPCALNIGTYALVKPRLDKKCRFFSINFTDAGIVEVHLDNLEFNSSHDWVNYIKGVVVEFAKLGIKPTHGFDIIFLGDIPNGAGLSSSASIEVLMATILNKHYNANLDGVTIALAGQAAENNYIGVKCGIMDQFAITMGKNNSAILLDCNTLSYEYAPLNLGEYLIVIANTNKQRKLADSKYNERLSECRQALSLLQQRLPIKALGEIDVATLEQNRDLIADEVIYKRARHAVSENQRTLYAVKELQQDNLTKFGELMVDSHISLRDDYEVTGFELDSLVAAALDHSGCIGARMTGAGFGGCTVNIVHKNSVDGFIAKVGDEYKSKTGLAADFYQVTPSNGARSLA